EATCIHTTRPQLQVRDAVTVQLIDDARGRCKRRCTTAVEPAQDPPADTVERTESIIGEVRNEVRVKRRDDRHAAAASVRLRPDRHRRRAHDVNDVRLILIDLGGNAATARNAHAIVAIHWKREGTDESHAMLPWDLGRRQERRIDTKVDALLLQAREEMPERM